jgi:hypothetical protein
MTPQERQLVDDLFDRLSKVEAAPRDRDALDAIARGQQRAPNAVYALVQTVLLQDEALKRAHDRITELEGGSAPEQAPPGGFLDSMRGALFGQSQPPQRGSVPSVPSPGSRPAWNTGQVIGQPAQGGYGQGGYGQQQPGYGQQQPQPQAGGGGGSFLGTAAAAAAGMVGGSLLLGSIRSMMGGSGSHSAFGDTANAGGGKNPWSSDSSSGGDLAKDAGVNDIGSSGHRAGAFDQAQADIDQDQDQDQDDHDAMDMDSDDFGGDDDSSFA